MAKLPARSWHFLLACLPPLAMALLLNRWFLLLLLVPFIAALMAASLHSRHRRGRCLRCGHALSPEQRHCAKCGLAKGGKRSAKGGACNPRPRPPDDIARRSVRKSPHGPAVSPLPSTDE